MKNIAILVPSYNSASTLVSTLQSILDQGDALDQHIDFVMLSDDGSKDSTVALAKSTWAHPTVPLRLKVAEVNQGEFRNVNRAFAAMPAHIDWVLIMHADNEALPGWINVLARECAKADPQTATISGSWQYIVDGRRVQEGDTCGEDHVETIEGTDASVRGTLFKGCWWHNSTAAIRVAAWKKVGGHPEDTALLAPLEILGLCLPTPTPRHKMRCRGDWDALLRMLSSGLTVRYVATPLIRYIENSASVSNGSSAFHGDLLEELQVMRRHRAVLSLTDIWKFHGSIAIPLARRFAGSILRGHWGRAGFAIAAAPYLIASLAVSSLDHARHSGGKLLSIPFGPDQPQST